jgi:hypothetical protein
MHTVGAQRARKLGILHNQGRRVAPLRRLDQGPRGMGFKGGTGEGCNEDTSKLSRRQRRRQVFERSLARLDHRTKPR